MNHASPSFEQPLSQLLINNLPPEQRIGLLEDNYHHVAEQFGRVATQRVVRLINDNCALTAVFNNHGDQVDAVRTVNTISSPSDPPEKQPFISFVEGTHNQDVHQEGLFQFSLDSAFGKEFNGAKPDLGHYYMNEREVASKYPWDYWRNRGLIERGSIIVPIDLRHYSAQYVETLIGMAYNEQFLLHAPDVPTIMNTPFDEMFKSIRTHGLKIMYSNGLREYASATQIVGVLSRALGYEEAQLQLTDDQRRKLDALRQERLHKNGVLPISVVYGTGHHAMVHVLRQAGVHVDRKFATANADGTQYAGSSMDQFFSSHLFDPRPIDIDKYARNMVLSHLLTSPLRNPVGFGVVVEANGRSEWQAIHNKINKLARSAELNDSIEEVYANFQKDPTMAVALLRSIGIPLRSI